VKKKGFIFDVDGVIADNPHEAAWRESLNFLFTERNNWKQVKHKTTYLAENFTTELYRKEISGKPRIDGARSVLKYFNVPDPDDKLLNEYCSFKQKIFLEKIGRGEFKIYDDAIHFILRAIENGGILVAASSSKNANQILERINISEFTGRVKYDFIANDTSLFKLFNANVCGIDVSKGKPDPAIFLKAAEYVKLSPEECLVIEDAVNGVQAAKAGNFFCIGVARLNNENELVNANADIVTNDLKKIFNDIFK
jgi:beta-phosphoglucomutase-like phosphatase (HAD superfamily)